MKFAIFLQNYFPYGGLQRDAVRLAEAAVAAGDEPTMVVSTWNGPKPSSFSILELHSGGHSNHSMAARFTEDCQSILSQEEYDTAICFSRVPGTPFHFCGDPCYQDKFQRTKSPLAKWLPRYRYLLSNESELFGNASDTHIFFLAASEIPAYQAHYPLKDPRYTLLPPWLKKAETGLGSQQDTKSKLVDELGLGSDSQFLLFVGSDFQRKGLDRAIEALAALKQSNIHLVACGQDNPSAYDKLASQLGIAGQVHCLGARDDIPQWMSASSLLIHPARQETAGMVLLEAMTYGLPVLCTEQCGYSTHVAQAGCPLLDKHINPDKLAQTIATALEQQSTLSQQVLAWASEPTRYHTADQILNAMRSPNTNHNHV